MQTMNCPTLEPPTPATAPSAKPATESTSRIAGDLAACCATCRGLVGELESSATAETLFAELVDRQRWEAAIRLAGHWLGKRKSVWWAAFVWWQQIRDEPTPDESHAVEAVVTWVLNPCEDTRRQVGAITDKLASTTVAGIVTRAVFWSEASVAPPNCPVVAPPPHMTGHLASSAVVLATAGDVERQRQALRFAAELHQQTEPWQRAPGRLG